MPTVTTSRVLLPGLSRTFSQRLTIAGPSNPHKSASARQKQPVPLYSYSRTATDNCVLRLRTATNVYFPKHPEGLPKTDVTKMKSLRSGNEDVDQTLAQAHARQANLSGNSGRQAADDTSSNSGVGGINQAYQGAWTPMNPTMGSNGGTSSMTMAFPNFSTQNSFSPYHMDKVQPIHALSAYQSPSFTQNMGAPNMPLPLTFYNPTLPRDSKGQPFSGLRDGGQHRNDRLSHNTVGTSVPQTITPLYPVPPLPPQKTKKEPSPASSRSASRHQLPISRPSAASGGVPEPTAAYLMRASFMPRRRPHPGPLLVVLDLNGTLLYRPARNLRSSFQRRPHADQFLAYCVQTFWVVIWSSAMPDNVARMVAQLLPAPAQRAALVAVWARDRFGLTPADAARRTQCYKRLARLWDDPAVAAAFPRDRPGCAAAAAAAAGRWDQGNTVLVDDSAEKARSEPHNAVTLPAFAGGAEAADVLPRVHDYLNELCYQEDVSAYIRAHPFTMADGRDKR